MLLGTCGGGAALSAVALKREKIPLDQKKESEVVTSKYPVMPTPEDKNLPEETAILTKAPAVPPPITRRTPARVIATIEATSQVLPIDAFSKYEFWPFNGSVPGPMIRARVGDVLVVRLINCDKSGMMHNMDFHAVMGPGGGAALLTADTEEIKTADFKLTYPGVYIYHCAVEPITHHISKGMFGLIVVEPEEGLPPVDKEFYVVQSELYTEPGEGDLLGTSQERIDNEIPSHVVFNGRVGSMTGEDENAPECQPLKAKVGESIRLFFGNAGPNLFSATHIIGTIFDKVYREGDLITPPARGLQTTTCAPGGAFAADFKFYEPGTYTLVDHAIGRVAKGAVGFIEVEGEKIEGMYSSKEPPRNCPGCKIHP